MLDSGALRHPNRKQIHLLLFLALGLLAGRLAAGSQGLGWIVLVPVAGLTALVPALPSALLLTGPAFLHVITYAWSSAATRADVLASPIVFLPVLVALFLPPLVRVLATDPPLFAAPALRRGGAGRWLLAWMVALVFILAVRTVGTPSPIYGATKTAGFVAFSLLPVLFVLLTVRSLRDVERVLSTLLVVGGTWVVLALALAAMRGNLNLYHADPGEIFGSTNQAGGGLAGRAGIVAVVAAAKFLTDRRGRLLSAVVGTSAILVMVLAGHRGSLLGLLGSLVLLMTMFVRRRKRRELGGLVLALTLMGFGAAGGWRLAPEFIRERYRDPLQSASFLARVSDQQATIEAWKSAPAFGQGTGSSSFVIAGVDQPAFGVVEGLYPHNVVVELLGEVGILGLLVYLFAFGGLAFAGFRVSRDAKAPSALATTVALVAGAFVESQVGADLTIHNDLWILSALLAVALAPHHAAQAHSAGR